MRKHRVTEKCAISNLILLSLDRLIFQLLIIGRDILCSYIPHFQFEHLLLQAKPKSHLSCIYA